MLSIPKTALLVILAFVSFLGAVVIYKYWYPPYLVIKDSEIATEVNLQTNFGPILIAVNPKNRFAAAQFTRFVKSGFYDGMRIHRTVPNLLVEMGDPLSRDPALRSLWGQGGSASVFRNEAGPFDQMEEGVVAFSGSNLGTYGSQFFIVTKTTSWLAGKHTIIGKVKLGMDVVEKIESVPVDSTGRPVSDIIVTSVTWL